MGLEKIKYFREETGEDNCFYATCLDEEVSHLIVNHSENDFPYVLSVNTLEEFRGNNLMENLLVNARDYYFNLGKGNLRSSLYPAPEVKGYYSYLEQKGLIQMGEDGRWEFI